MRSSETYRGARRNTINKHGKRALNKAFETRDGSKGATSQPTLKMWHPPTRVNARVRDEELRGVKSAVVGI